MRSSQRELNAPPVVIIHYKGDEWPFRLYAPLCAAWVRCRRGDAVSVVVEEPPVDPGPFKRVVITDQAVVREIAARVKRVRNETVRLVGDDTATIATVNVYFLDAQEKRLGSCSFLPIGRVIIDGQVREGKTVGAIADEILSLSGSAKNGP